MTMYPNPRREPKRTSVPIRGAGVLSLPGSPAPQGVSSCQAFGNAHPGLPCGWARFRRYALAEGLLREPESAGVRNLFSVLFLHPRGRMAPSEGQAKCPCLTPETGKQRIRENGRNRAQERCSLSEESAVTAAGLLGGRDFRRENTIPGAARPFISLARR